MVLVAPDHAADGAAGGGGRARAQGARDPQGVVGEAARGEAEREPGHGRRGAEPRVDPRGGAEDEHLGGGAGADTVFGAGGDDLIDGDANADRLEGGVGEDTLRGGAGNDLLTGGADADVLDGGEGIDLARYGASGAGVEIDKLVQAVPEPTDFDAYWDKQKKILAAVPVKYQMKKVSKEGAKVEVFAVSIITGIWDVSILVFDSRHRTTPSITGIIKSVTIRSGTVSLAF